jgi:hypothetical protein
MVKDVLALIETDHQGNVVTRPVLGWVAAPLAETSVLLRMRYAETPQDIDKGGLQLQFVLTPPQDQELAAELTRQAERILRLRPIPGRSH